MHRNIKKLYFSELMGGLYFYVPIFALFLLKNDITLSTIILGQMVYSALSFSFEIPTGAIADRFGHNKSVAMGYFADATGILLVAIFPTPTFLLVAMGIRGISGGLLSGSKEALLYEYSAKEEGNYKKDLSHLRSWAVLGFAVSALITGFVVQRYGEPSYFYLLSATVLSVAIATIIAMTLPAAKIFHRDSRSKLYEIKKNFSLFKSNKLLRRLFVIAGLTYAGRYLLFDLYQPYFELNNVAPFFLGFSLFAASIAGFIALRNAYKIEKLLRSPRLAMGVLAVATGALYVGLGSFHNPYVLVVVLIILFGIMEAPSIFITDYANENALPEVRATVLSTIGLGREIFKFGYKAVFVLAVGLVALSDLFIYFGIYLILGAILSYVLLSPAHTRK